MPLPLTTRLQLPFRRSNARLRSEDATTGLPLLAHLYPNLEGVLDGGRPLGLLFLHLVQFSVLEKMLAHDASSKLLRMVGLVLRDSVGKLLRTEDVATLGYGGGSDFMVFLAPSRTGEPLLEKHLTEIARRVEHSVCTQLEAAEPALAKQRMLNVNVGYALIEPAPLPVQVIIHRAIEQASGRARDVDWSAKQELERQLVPILRERQVSTVYQPIVSLVDGKVAAYEALTRGPSGSSLRSPDQLFGAAEKLGLLEPLERLCRETALRGALNLPEPSRLFINVSPEIVGDPVAAKHLLLTEAMPAARIVVELTERQAIRDFDTFRRTLDMYRAYGFGIAVDDAGAGHSSMRAVAALRPDFIKIDMSLVRDIDRDRAKYALVAALTTFARRIDADVIAEGVETQAELESLIEIGVPYGQGFFIAYPAEVFQRPADRLAEAIRDRIELREKQVTGQVLCVSDVAKPAKSLDVRQPCRAAEELFRANPSLQALAVVEGGSPVGLISRDKFFAKLGSQYGYSIFAARSVREAMNSSTLVVEGSESLDLVSRKAVHRRGDDLYDHIVVADGGRLKGLLSVIDLLDITTRRQVSIAKYSNPLSGLPGNVLIHKETDRRLLQGQPFVFCHIDLNHFKRYNDRYGFSAGDQVILLLANIIQQAKGSSEDFVGHIGGDDFVLLTDAERVVPACSVVVREFRAAGVAGPTTLSIAAVTCRYGMTFEDISAGVFKTKKLAKARGGNAMVWDGKGVPVTAEEISSAERRKPRRRPAGASKHMDHPAGLRVLPTPVPEDEQSADALYA